MNFLKSTTMVLFALCVFSTLAIAAPEACTGISKKCTKDVLYDKDIDGTTFSCYDCKQVLCKDGGDGGLAGTKTTSVCTEKRASPTGFTPTTDDGASFDTTTEMAPEPGQQRDHRKSEKGTDHRGAGLRAPTNLSANKTSRTAVGLSWVDNSDSEFGVELYRIDPIAGRSGQAADWEFIGLFEERISSNVKGTGLRADQDDNLTPDTRYCYRLRAYAGFDRTSVSAFSETVCTKTKP